MAHALQDISDMRTSKPLVATTVCRCSRCHYGDDCGRSTTFAGYVRACAELGYTEYQIATSMGCELTPDNHAQMREILEDVRRARTN